MKTFIFILTFFINVQVVKAEWTFDFSRRTNKVLEVAPMPVPKNVVNEASIFESAFEPSAPVQELVIMNTDKGFVPATVRVKSGMNYRVHVVNINEDNKNISFVMDAFSEHHATYFGSLKTFNIRPKQQGVFTFQCPETSAQGKLVVYPAVNLNRLPASRN